MVPACKLLQQFFRPVHQIQQRMHENIEQRLCARNVIRAPGYGENFRDESARHV